MDRSAMRSRFRERFGDTAANFRYTDAEINAYLNEAYREVVTAENWPFLETRAASVTVTANSATVSLPLDIWRVLAIWNDTDDILLEPLHHYKRGRRRYFDNTDGGQPSYYRLIGNTIEVFPRPTVSTTLLIDHYSPVVDMSADGNEPIFPEPYHSMLIEGAMYRAYLDDGNAPHAAAHRENFQSQLMSMRKDMLGDREEGPTPLVDTWYETTGG